MFDHVKSRYGARDSGQSQLHACAPWRDEFRLQHVWQMLVMAAIHDPTQHLFANETHLRRGHNASGLEGGDLQRAGNLLHSVEIVFGRDSFGAY